MLDINFKTCEEIITKFTMFEQANKRRNTRLTTFHALSRVKAFQLPSILQKCQPKSHSDHIYTQYGILYSSHYLQWFKVSHFKFCNIRKRLEETFKSGSTRFISKVEYCFHLLTCCKDRQRYGTISKLGTIVESQNELKTK